MRVEIHLGNQSNHLPKRLTINKIGLDLYEATLNSNVEILEVEGETYHKFDTTLLQEFCKDLDELKGALVRLKYTPNQEYAVINKGIEDKSHPEYIAYREFINYIKQEANTFWNTL